jgi:hypothetical protein
MEGELDEFDQRVLTHMWLGPSELYTAVTLAQNCARNPIVLGFRRAAADGSTFDR